jgi:hypothetical protein
MERGLVGSKTVILPETVRLDASPGQSAKITVEKQKHDAIEIRRVRSYELQFSGGDQVLTRDPLGHIHPRPGFGCHAAAELVRIWLAIVESDEVSNDGVGRMRDAKRLGNHRPRADNLKFSLREPANSFLEGVHEYVYKAIIGLRTGFACSAGYVRASVRQTRTH